MSELRKAAQQALEYLDAPTAQLFKDARLALRAALAQPEPEPVAYQWLGTSVIRKRVPKTAEADAWQPLYTHPPQRKPLTDQEAKVLWADVYEPGHHLWIIAERFARSIERAHGIE